MTARLLLCLVLLVTGCSSVEEPVPEGPLSGERLVEALRDGGYVLFVRHTATTEGGTDDPAKASDCSKQRNLTEEGRQQARDIGRAVDELDVPVGRVLASPYCRTMETARLAFGDDARPEEALLPPPGVDAPGQEQAVAATKELLAEEPEDDTNTVLVGHVSSIEPAAGATPEEGGGVVFRPDGDGGFQIVAEVAPAGWQSLVQQVS